MDKIIASYFGEEVGEFFLRHRDLINRIVRYIISGTSAAAVSIATLYFATDILGVWYLYGSTLGFIFGLVVSFFLQKLWTFQNAENHPLIVGFQFGRYVLVAILNLAANTTFMYALVEWLSFWHILAQAVTSGLIALVTFFAYGRIFRQSKTSNAN